MKTKRKYIHIEVNLGHLYVYADDKRWKNKLVTLEQMDTECDMGEIPLERIIKLAIPLSDFLEKD